MMVIPNNNPGCRPVSMLNLAGFLAKSEVNGPGTRAVIWVQGCPLCCPGCFNAQFQPFSPATLIPVNELAETIRTLSGIDGVTFSGGEPFAQAGPLAELGRQLRGAGLSIVTYTGYTTEQLATGDDPAWPSLLAVTDLIIAGPYIAGMAKPDLLKGSSNQQVISLSIKIPIPLTSAHPGTDACHAEFTIGPDGTVTTTGFPAPAIREPFGLPCRGV